MGTHPPADAASGGLGQRLRAGSRQAMAQIFSTHGQVMLLISTPDEWGAVLSDGMNLLGCSLYPTKEISPFSADRGTIGKASFYFARNPIEATGGSLLWAAGRVPSDVSAITYRLPGKRDIAAKIDVDGYWMVMFHTDSDLAEGSVQDWPPIVVTVTRPSGTQRITIPFTEQTMCRQVTHGC